MKNLTPDKIRERVLKERGIQTFKPGKHRRKRMHPSTQRVIDPKLKTPLMRYLELVHGEPIESVLLSGSLSVVAKKLDNKVDVSTLSKWIKKLHLRYSKDNLPQCNGCKSYGPACESGICYVLMEMELYSLLPIKKEEMLDESN